MSTLVWFLVTQYLYLFHVISTTTTPGFYTIKTQQQQSYNPQKYAYSPPSTQPEQGKAIESIGINQNNYPQAETLVRGRDLMTQKNEIEKDSEWGKFIRKHWKMVATFVIAGILIFIGSIYVFLWFTKDAQTTGLVPSTLGLWTMGNIVSFILHLIFWEVIFIGIPAIVGAVASWQWWKRLAEQEKKEYHLSGKSSRASRAGGAISPLLFIAFAIKVYVDGNWNVAISTYALDYVVGSVITILVWIVAIFGIPATIGTIWWIRHEMNKKP